MSQIFSMTQTSATASIDQTVETTLVTSLFLSAPFQTCKMAIQISIQMALAGATCLATVKLYRNPDGENLLLKTYTGLQLQELAGTCLAMGFEDVMDGRALNYRVTVTQTGGHAAVVGNGTLNVACLSG